MEEFISQSRLLLATLGYSIFEPDRKEIELDDNKSASEAPVFQYSGKGFDAKLDVDIENGLFVVRAGSRARKEEAGALQPTYKKLRNQLLSDRVLLEEGDSLLFHRSHGFPAITAAAQVVSGQTVNGRVMWKTAENKSFKDWQETLLSDEEVD